MTMTTADVGNLISYTPATIAAKMRAGSMPGHQAHRYGPWHLTESELAAWIADRQAEARRA